MRDGRCGALPALLGLVVLGCGSGSDRSNGAAALAGPSEVSWGRLVDVHDLDPATGVGALRLADVPVGPRVASGGALTLERDFAAGLDRLTIAHAFGTRAFDAALSAAVVLPPVNGAVPRDAVLVLRFASPVGEAHLAAGATFVAHLGVPLDARVLADPTNPRRLVIDPSVSALEGQRSGVPVGGAAWPAAEELELRAGGVVSASFPTGGFLPPLAGPRVLGRQPIDLLDALPGPGGHFLLTLQYRTPECLRRPTPGDVVQLATATVQVVEAPSSPISVPRIGVVEGVRVALIAGPASAVVPGPGEYLAPWDPSAGDPPECFVRLSPTPGTPPAGGVSSDASLAVHFSEPMDPTSFEVFGTFALERENHGGPLERRVVGAVQVAPTLDAFTFVPTLPLTTHAGAAPARYRFELDGSEQGVRSLGGAALVHDLPPAVIAMDAGQPPVSTSGIALVFDAGDEDGNGSPELRGQIQRKISQGVIRPRPVLRFSSVVDTSQTVLALKRTTLYRPTIAAPFSQYGAKLMTVWRYHDVGFSLLDENYHNLDVEGLHWAPLGGSVVADGFDQFQMSLSHGGYLPDEALTTGLLPMLPVSGVRSTYDANLLDPAEDPATVVHSKTAGYTIDPLELFTASSGTPMMPWPMNRGLPPSQYTYWTWRDTGVQAVGAPNGKGADTRFYRQLTGFGSGFYPADSVPTIGLPLLTEYRVYPDANATGANTIETVVAINSSARPFFRALSVGGVLLSGAVKTVDPDNEPVATGGVAANGTSAPPQDNALHFGQADFVVRVSRAHSVWFDAGSASTFHAPVIEPSASLEPSGTQRVLAFRGAVAMTSPNADPWTRSENLDAYGESYTAVQHQVRGTDPNDAFTPTFHPDASWTADTSDLDGARWFQVRLTMISDPQTGETSTISAVGVPYD